MGLARADGLLQSARVPAKARAHPPHRAVLLLRPLFCPRALARGERVRAELRPAPLPRPLSPGDILVHAGERVSYLSLCQSQVEFSHKC